MAKPKEYMVDSIGSFSSIIEKLLKASVTRHDGVYNGNWYRGVAQANAHTLTPTLYRHPSVKKLDELLILESRMMEDFERNNVLHQDPVVLGQNADGLKTLFYMQHYGIPTRLLDWTSNPFIALYFALSSAREGVDGFPEDAAVWVLDPVQWNETSLNIIGHGKAGPLAHSSAVENYGPRQIFNGKLGPTGISTLYERPAAILGIANSARMFAQRGVFTVFGRDLKPMEIQFADEKFPSTSLVKLVIPKDKISPLLGMLLRIGYTDSVSYPDLHGLAMEIKRMNGFWV